MTGQKHIINSTSVSVSSPNLQSVEFNQKQILFGNNLVVSNIEIGNTNTNIYTSFKLFANNLIISSPVFESPTLKLSLFANSLTINSIELSNPEISIFISKLGKPLFIDESRIKIFDYRKDEITMSNNITSNISILDLKSTSLIVNNTIEKTKININKNNRNNLII